MPEGLARFKQLWLGRDPFVRDEFFELWQGAQHPHEDY
jgi:hypothetical protein